jgi:hypothetical protein
MGTDRARCGFFYLFSFGRVFILSFFNVPYTILGYEPCAELTGPAFQSVFNLQLWASNAKLINYYMLYGCGFISCSSCERRRRMLIICDYAGAHLGARCLSRASIFILF